MPRLAEQLPQGIQTLTDVQALRARLTAAGQGHVLAFWDRLTDPERKALAAEAGAIRWEDIPAIVGRYVRSKPAFRLPADLAPAACYPRDHSGAGGGRSWDREQYAELGRAALRAGRVAAFTVAGGQGTRLGFDGPKGCLGVTPVTGSPLFRVFAESILAASRRCGAPIPWYIMTSPLNHAATGAFLRDHKWFGLPATDVVLFEQGTSPSFDMATGRVLMASPSRIAVNPDGHGGAITALHRSGATADMARRGVDTISYFQVDNPLVRAVDPAFIGLHLHAPDSSSEMSSKMIAKAYPEEKLGVFCSIGGRTTVIEYSDLPASLQAERGPDGRLRFDAGSIAIHMVSVGFVDRLATDPAFELPWHRAEKKVDHVDPETGRDLCPAAPNAVKLERFVFDALPLCRASVVLETDRADEFAPVKNPTGVDSVESSRRMQIERAARWLESAGVRVPRAPDGSPDCVLEIGPLTAQEPADLAALRLPVSIEPGASVVV